jgi:hypothetical protein
MFASNSLTKPSRAIRSSKISSPGGRVR